MPPKKNKGDQNPPPKAESQVKTTDKAKDDELMDLKIKLAKAEGVAQGQKTAMRAKPASALADNYEYEKGEMKAYSSKGVRDLLFPRFDQFGKAIGPVAANFQDVGTGLLMLKTDCVNLQELIEIHPEFGKDIKPLHMNVARGMESDGALVKDSKYTKGSETTKSTGADLKTEIIHG